MDVTSKAINDGLSRTMEAPLCLVLGSGVVVVVGLVREVVPSKNYSMLMCNHFYLFVKDEDK
jgi:hypothetical protein